jgi:hypothetical protein
MEGYLPYYWGVEGVEIVGKTVGLGVVSVGVSVIVGVTGVHEAVYVGVIEGVNEDVIVTDAVHVAGTNGVHVRVLVEVCVTVGVRVKVGVIEAVLVTIGGVRLRVGEAGVAVNVKVDVTVGVKSEAFGASATAIQPMQ